MATIKIAIGYVIRAIKHVGVISLTPDILHRGISNSDALEKADISALFYSLHDLVIVVYYYQGKLVDPSVQLQALTAEYQNRSRVRPTARDFLIIIENALVKMGFMFSITRSHVHSVDLCKTVADFDGHTMALAICYVVLVSRLLHTVLFTSINVSAIHVCADSVKKEDSVNNTDAHTSNDTRSRSAMHNPKVMHLKKHIQHQNKNSNPVKESKSTEESIPEILNKIHEDLESIRRYTRKINIMLPRWSCSVSEALHPAEIADIMDGKAPPTESDRTKIALCSRKQANSQECLQRIAHSNAIIDTIISLLYKGLSDKKHWISTPDGGFTPYRQRELYINSDQVVNLQTLKQILEATYLSTSRSIQEGERILFPFVKSGERYHHSLKPFLQQHSEKHLKAMNASTRRYNSICKIINDLLIDANSVSLRRLRDFANVGDSE